MLFWAFSAAFVVFGILTVMAIFGAIKSERAFKSFAIGNESIPDVRIRFADLWKESTYQETGSRIGKKVMQTQPMLLGADFLRSHRTLIAHSQRRVYFTYTGGPVFQVARPPPAN